MVRKDFVIITVVVLMLSGLIWVKMTSTPHYRVIAEKESQRILRFFRTHPKELEKTAAYFRHPIVSGIRNLPPNEDGKIFVSIASYRDSELIHTVDDLIQKAKRPERLVVCVCLQEDEAEMDGVVKALSSRSVTLRLITMPYCSARGPTWARYLIQCEWRGEQYYMQIDSHMRFVDGWDEVALASLKRCPAPKACLTGYVAMYDHETGRVDPARSLRGPLLMSEVNERDGFFRFNAHFVGHRPRQPMRSWGWSACFSFSSSELIRDAPYDPKTPYLFFGEETDISARLSDGGWQFYASDKPICFTTFVRSYRPTFWKDHPDQKSVEQLSRVRVYHRLGLIPPEVQPMIPDELIKGQYSLGSINSFDKYATAVQRYRYKPSNIHK